MKTRPFFPSLVLIVVMVLGHMLPAIPICFRGGRFLSPKGSFNWDWEISDIATTPGIKK